MGLFSTISCLLFPRKCVVCRRVISGDTEAICLRCLTTLSHPTFLRHGKYFSDCCTALFYTGAIRDAILRFKFQDQPGYAVPFGELLANTICHSLPDQYDLITWVPVSQSRLAQRGYDQARLLAEVVGKQLELPVLRTLYKQTNNAAQSSLTGVEARFHNVQDVYIVPEPWRVEGQTVLLIDDIITTGATMDEASRTLLSAGATGVIAATLAQPPTQ